jgi:uncharacterized membrane protein
MTGKHADHRKHRREQFRSRPPSVTQPRRNVAFVIAGLVLLAAFAYALTRRQAAQPWPDVVAAEPGGDVRLDAAQFDDGRARFFEYVGPAGRHLRFFVLKSSDGVIRAAFDTCDVCYRARRGYRQEGDALVCNNCGQVFRSVDVNVLQGGCNPVPLDRFVSDGQVVLTAAALQAGTAYF